MVLVVGFMLVKVLPQVQVLYDGIKGAQLPLITRMLLSVSNFVVKFWWLLAGLLAFAVISTSKWSKTIGGKRFFDKLKMKSPGVGQLFMKLYMARFARTGHTLVASGVPLLQMLEITSKSVDNVYIETSLKVASEKVKGGKALSDSIENDSNFLDLVPKMINIGEQSGSLELMLDKTAEYYEKEVDQQIKTISTIIEPAMMVVLGIVALVVVAAVLLPVYGLAGQTGFGG
jgi:type IV pilus assembly protein PilC